MNDTNNRLGRFWRELNDALCALHRVQWQAPWQARGDRRC